MRWDTAVSDTAQGPGDDFHAHIGDESGHQEVNDLHADPHDFRVRSKKTVNNVAAQAQQHTDQDGRGICLIRILWIMLAVPLRPDVYTVTFSYPLTWTITSILFILYYCFFSKIRIFRPRPERMSDLA